MQSGLLVEEVTSSRHGGIGALEMRELKRMRARRLWRPKVLLLARTQRKIERSNGRLTVERVVSTRRWICRMVMRDWAAGGEERSAEGVYCHDCWSVGEFDELAVGAAPEASVVLLRKSMVNSHELESDDRRIWSFIVVIPLERQAFSQPDL